MLFSDNLQHVKEIHAKEEGVYTKARGIHLEGFHWRNDMISFEF